MKTITVSDVEYLAYKLAKEHFSFNEPIPDFSTRYPNVLESCVVTPFQTFSGKALYPSLVGKASILFYLMVKNHPFQNGNKRIAMTTLLMFLHRNGKWVRVDPHQLYRFTVWVAESLPEVKGQVIEGIRIFLQKHLVSAR